MNISYSSNRPVLDSPLKDDFTEPMALRVLLADESPTIRKVIQISLQDYGVEVKAVPVGLDVQEIARQFHPDLILADVLLQKKNGYEVCRDLKNDPELTSIPVVLMWSSFMELDQGKVAEARPDGQLEKPFDAQMLRSLVHRLVPKTATQSLSGHLIFPDLPKFEPTISTVAPPPKEATQTRTWTMESFEEPPRADTVIEEADQFAQIPLKKVHQFRVDVPENSEEPQVQILSAPVPPPSVSAADVPTVTRSPIANLPPLSEQQLEEIIRAQSKEIIEKIVWKLVPDLATNLIKEEIRRLTEEPKL